MPHITPNKANSGKLIFQDVPQGFEKTGKNYQ